MTFMYTGFHHERRRYCFLLLGSIASLLLNLVVVYHTILSYCRYAIRDKVTT